MLRYKRLICKVLIFGKIALLLSFFVKSTNKNHKTQYNHYIFTLEFDERRVFLAKGKFNEG